MKNLKKTQKFLSNRCFLDMLQQEQEKHSYRIKHKHCLTKSKVTQLNEFLCSPTDQINNNDPKDGVWFDNGDTYVNCKTDSQTFWPKTLIISAHNVADADKKLVDFVWHISIDEDVVTITKNGEEVKGTDTQKDEYLEKVFRDLGSNF